MGIAVHAMLLGAFVAACASPAGAKDARLAGWPLHGVSIFERAPQTLWRMGHVVVAPEPPPNGVMPDRQNAVPAEFNFNITLTLRPNHRHGVHGSRSGRASHGTDRRRRRRFDADSCRG